MHNKTADPVVLTIITAAIVGILFTGSFISIQEPNKTNSGNSNNGDVLGVSDSKEKEERYSDLSMILKTTPKIADIASSEKEATADFVSLQINDTRLENDWNLQIEYAQEELESTHPFELYFGIDEINPLENEEPLDLLSSNKYSGNEIQVNVKSKVRYDGEFNNEKIKLMLTLF